MSKSELAVPTAPSRLSDHDLHLFNEGTHYAMADKLGAHLVTVNGEEGTQFGVWAPNAQAVSVIGDFNGWDKSSHPIQLRSSSGIWEGFIPGVGKGTTYKFHIQSSVNGYRVDKADPYALYSEMPPKTGSVVWDLDYEWQDLEWMTMREERHALDAPMSIYEVHFGSWMRVPEEGDRSLTYREMADRLGDYVEQMGYTHVELMPIMEHPFYGSWGYQTTGFFAPTSRYGTPQDLMYMIDKLHQRGIGVILDWVPSHFPSDEHGPGFFDGTHLYEHADSRGIHPDWNSFVFNYGRHEVRSFLLSSAIHWFRTYHADGLRVDAVASMLYLDYSRKPGDWTPNIYGGREDLDALAFLRHFNEACYEATPGIQTFAEESTSWPGVSRPTYVGGLGFGMKWDMGWMHDTLGYISHDPIHRRFHHNELTFRMLYAFNENFLLPLSHDEVTHGKGSLASKMPGDHWQQLANLRLLHGYMHAQPGKKLLFMGGEIAQWKEWQHDESLDWSLLEYEPHRGMQQWVRDLNRLHGGEPALHEVDFEPAGFEWIDGADTEGSVISFLRKGKDPEDMVLVVANFTPVPRLAYKVGVPKPGYWRELLNSDAPEYGGSGVGNLGGVEATETTWHGRPWSLNLSIPPLGCLFLKAPA
jgi:1,4-alpha-glucan branching enzyme